MSTLQQSGPLFDDVGVIGLVPDRWSGLWQPRHQVMRRLAAFFHVTWVHPATEWRRVLGQRAAVVTQPVPGLEVYDPPRHLPLVYRPAAIGRLLQRRVLADVRRRLRARGASRVVLYLWRPHYVSALDTAHDFSVYHIDDDYSFDPERVGVDALEASVLRRVDRVIIHSPALMELKGGVNPRTVSVPNGVDFAAFTDPAPEPADLAAVPGPRVGYAGWLKPQLDWALLDEVAVRCPDLSFVFVGHRKLPDRLDADESFRAFTGRPNVFLLGGKSPEELAAYARYFDVCVMPYRLDRYTDCIYPLKLHEYLASGRPVVGSPIRTLTGFRDVVTLAHGPDEWCAALRAAMGPEADSRAAVTARRRVAHRHDWWTLTGRIAELIATGLELSGTERVGALAASRVAPVDPVAE